MIKKLDKFGNDRRQQTVRGFCRESWLVEHLEHIKGLVQSYSNVLYRKVVLMFALSAR